MSLCTNEFNQLANLSTVEPAQRFPSTADRWHGCSEYLGQITSIGESDDSWLHSQTRWWCWRESLTMEDMQIRLGRQSTWIVYAEMAFVVTWRYIVEPPVAKVEVTPMALDDHPPARWRFSATDGIHGPHGVDLTIFKSEGWAWCSHMGLQTNIFQMYNIPDNPVKWSGTQT